MSPLPAPWGLGPCAPDAGLAELGCLLPRAWPPARWTEGLEEATPGQPSSFLGVLSTALGLVAWVGALSWGLGRAHWPGHAGSCPEGGCVQGLWES